MINFLIGQYDKFDYVKFNRDYRAGIYGIQACQFKSEDDIYNLQSEAKKYNLKIGIHFPLIDGIYPYRDPLFMALNPETRLQSYKAVVNELEFIKEKEINPEYVLFHYPKPAIIKDDFDFSRWRFYHQSEYALESEYPFEKFAEYSEELFQWLTDTSYKYKFTPVLEFDAINRYISESTFLDTLLEKYTNIKLCLDTGRLHVQDKIDPNFNALDIFRRFTKYAELIHLWHAKVGNVVEYNHFPLLPGLRPCDGWADVEEYFKVIRAENKHVKLLFEHRTDLISDEELDSCYTWIDNLMNMN